MKTIWDTNEDGTLSCRGCGLESFTPGSHCQCPAGGPATTQERGSSGRARRAQLEAGPLADKPTKRKRREAPGPLTAREVGVKLKALCEAARRLRIAAEKLPTEDEAEFTERGGIRWREAWRGHHSKFSLRAEAIDRERKVLVSAREAALDLEQLQETERKERIARALIALREGRTDVARRELGEEDVVH